MPFGETFGVVGCMACYQRDRIQPELQANRRAAFGLDTGRYADMRLATFKPLTANESKAHEAAQAIAEKWQTGGVRSLWLWSPILEPAGSVPVDGKPQKVTGCGNGKTHLAIALADVAVNLGKSLMIREEKDMLDKIKATYDDNATTTEGEVINRLNEAWLLVLDDLGTAGVKAESLRWYQGIVYGLVNTRYVSNRPIIITTNLAPDALEDRLGERTTSRLAEMAVVFHLDGPDRRYMRR